MKRPSVTVLYHYMSPDDVVGGRIMTDLAEGLAARGHSVIARPSNRAWRDVDERPSFPLHELRNGVRYERVWRPPLRQSKAIGRLGNAAWIVAAWSAAVLREPTDVVVIGTDPILSVLAARVIKRARPGVKIAHWCFDLYPEAAMVEGIVSPRAGRAIQSTLAPAYRACDLVVDLGPCMRARLDAYDHGRRALTIPPWALVEPPRPITPDPEARRALFGDASLALLYAGTFGRAHAHEAIVALSRRLRDANVRTCFGVRGNREDALRSSLDASDTNIAIAPFADERALAERLGAADIHLASLREDWDGVVVPSKFFGSLAIGRPVIFAGSRKSSLARWIEEHGVGWVLDASSIDRVEEDLRAIARDRDRLTALQQRCHATYAARFSKAIAIERWAEAINYLM